MKIIREMLILFIVGAFTSVSLVFTQEKPSLEVVVVDLKLDLELANASTSEDQGLAKKASDRLRAEIAKNGHYTLIGSGRIDQTLQAIKDQGLPCATHACAWEVSKMLDADRVVIGKIMKISTLISLVSARMIDVKTGKILREETLELKGTFSDIVPNAMAALSRRLTEEFDETLTQHPK